MNLKTNLCGIEMKNPLILASGILGVDCAIMSRVIENRAGAVTIKSISFDERSGHNSPTMIGFGEVFMNAVGYSNPGAAEAKKEFADLKKKINGPVIGSIIGTNAEDFVKVYNELKDIPFDAIEIPLSCPHTPGFGTLAGQGTPEATAEITKALKKVCKKPIIVKLSPNSANLGEVAKAAEKEGAAAINMGNTHGPGMKINIETAQPVLDFKVGGISGPAIKPIAVRCVYDLYKTVKIPIIGTGGVTSGEDAIEMLMAGASAVGVGTAVYYRGIGAFESIEKEIKEWMQKNGYEKIEDLVGLAHEI